MQQAADAAFHACSELSQGVQDMVHATQQINADLSSTAQTELQSGRNLRTSVARSVARVIGGSTAGNHVDRRLGRIASTLAGEPVEVRCWTNRGDWHYVTAEFEPLVRTDVRTLAGFAVFTESRIQLAPGVCRTLTTIEHRRSAPTLGAAFAVGVLAHESTHLTGANGVTNEAKTECLAVRRIARTAKLLGYSSHAAETLARIYWTRIYPFELPSYQLASCPGP